MLLLILLLVLGLPDKLGIVQMNVIMKQQRMKVNMTPPKTIDQVRDEMAEKYYLSLPVGGLGLAKISFMEGFDASTKYHEEKYRKLVEAMKLIKVSALKGDETSTELDCFHISEDALKELGGKGEA